MSNVTPAAMTIPEASRYSGMSRTRLYGLFNEGKLHPRRAGKRTLVLTDELRAYVASLPPAPIRVRAPAQETA